MTRLFRYSAICAMAMVLLAGSLPAAMADEHSGVSVGPRSAKEYRLGGHDTEVYEVRVKIIEGPGVTIFVSRGNMTREPDGDYSGEAIKTKHLTTAGEKIRFDFKIVGEDGDRDDYYLTIVNYDTANASVVDVRYDITDREDDGWQIVVCIYGSIFTVLLVIVVIGIVIGRRGEKKRAERIPEYEPTPDLNWEPEGEVESAERGDKTSAGESKSQKKGGKKR